jgi:hypothetical protein
MVLFSGARQMAYSTKRSRYFYLPAESADSLDYKERLALVDTPSPKFGGQSHYRGSLDVETESTFMDDVESGSTETDSPVSDSGSDSSETEPDMNVTMTILTG